MTTDQNYQPIRQKLGTILENMVLKESKFSKKFIYKNWSPSPIFFTEKKSERFCKFLMLKNDFEEVVHDFGRSDNAMI